MSPLVRKELRLILPAWVLAMVLAVFPVWAFWPGAQGFMPQSLGGMVFVPFGIGVLLLAITPFGGELSLGTFSVLLAQPVARRRLWLAKITVAGLALGLTFVALCISNHLRVDSVLETMKSTVWQNAFRRPGQTDKLFLSLITDTREAALRETLVIGGMSVLAAFAGGLWTTLLFRQTSAAFWSTFLVPMALGLLTAKLLGGFSAAAVDIGLLLVLGLYAAAGMVWAWRLFARVQDVQWTGGVVSLPAWGRKEDRAREFASEHRRNRLGTLLRNELQSQYINLLIAGGLLVLHVAILIFRRLNAAYLSSHISLAMILESFPLLWLMVPLLVGSVAIAEERKLGTLENLLCLPTTRRFQFIVKLGVSLGLGFLLGAVLPFVLERFAAKHGVTGNPTGLWVINGSHSIPFLLLFGSVVLNFLSFYASTLTRNTLQALGASVLVTVLGFILIALAVIPPKLGDVVLWGSGLIGLVGFPVMGLIVLGLAYANYKHLQSDLHMWFRNAATLLIAIASVGGLTTLVYHRAWEAWLPPEPKHSFASSYYSNRGRHFPATPKLRATISRVGLLLPDGRLWVRHRQISIQQVPVNGQLITISLPKGHWRAEMLPGSDWRDFAASETKCFAIKADGTLWDISPTQAKGPSRVVPRQVETSHDWKSISGEGGHFTALKSDGTLWEWGRIASASGKSAIELAAPVRVGTEADWMAVGSNERINVAVKSDGSFWRWGRFYSSTTNGSMKWTVIEHPERWLEGPKQQPTSISLSESGIAVVYDDGTLWLGGELPPHLRSLLAENAQLASRELVRWTDESDWKEVRLYPWGEAVGVKREGSLWRWDSYSIGWPNPTWVASRFRPSQYSDWLAACWDGNAILTFAADGNLCLWGDPREERYYAYDHPNPEQLLLPSRLKAKRVAMLAW